MRKSRFTQRKPPLREGVFASEPGWFGSSPVGLGRCRGTGFDGRSQRREGGGGPLRKVWDSDAHLGCVNKTGTEWGLEPLLSAAELAEYLGLPVATIYDWRSHGAGPVAHRIGKHVKLTLTDVRTWLDSCCEAPSQPARPGAGEHR